MFISVFLSESEGELATEDESKDPRGFFFYPCCIREFSQIPRLLLGTIYRHGFLNSVFTLP
jgi:hypothetical protein